MGRKVLYKLLRADGECEFAGGSAESTAGADMKFHPPLPLALPWSFATQPNNQRTMGSLCPSANGRARPGKDTVTGRQAESVSLCLGCLSLAGLTFSQMHKWCVSEF